MILKFFLHWIIFRYVKGQGVFVINTVVGSGTAGSAGDGVAGGALSAQLNNPYGVTVDTDGTMYIADYGNYKIRKVTPVGTVSTFWAGTNYLIGVHVCNSGNVFTTHWGHRVYKITPAGVGTIFAGNPSDAGGWSGDGVQATSSYLNQPHGVFCLYSSGSGYTVYIADKNNYRIRKVSPTGIITTVAGNGGNAWGGEGIQATSAGLYRPQGVFVLSDGTIYIPDRLNYRLRVVSPTGIITTLAGNGSPGSTGDNGPATSALVADSCSIQVASDGTVYWADSYLRKIRKVDPSGDMYFVSGSSTSDGFSGDGGPASNAMIATQNVHVNIALSPDESILYIADIFNNRIRAVFNMPTFIVKTTFFYI